MMRLLSSSSTTSNLICASLQPRNNNSRSVGKEKVKQIVQDATQKSLKKQPTVAEMERAIGAGMFRDNEPMSSRESGEPLSLFDILSSTPISQPESALEKKLRETGEWVIDATEGPRSPGRDILLVVCFRILPVWLLFLMIAFGVIKLPFDSPTIDDWIM